MKKLEDITKKNIFEVPDGYFDRLPLKIQARLEKSVKRHSISVFALSLKYALPVLVIGLVAYLFWPKPSDQNDLLASVPIEHLITYLSESDISTDDLLEEAKFNETEADSLNAVINANYIIEGVDLSDMQDVLDNEL